MEFLWRHICLVAKYKPALSPQLPRSDKDTLHHGLYGHRPDILLQHLVFSCLEHTLMFCLLLTGWPPCQTGFKRKWGFFFFCEGRGQRSIRHICNAGRLSFAFLTDSPDCCLLWEGVSHLPGDIKCVSSVTPASLLSSDSIHLLC